LSPAPAPPLLPPGVTEGGSQANTAPASSDNSMAVVVAGAAVVIAGIAFVAVLLWRRCKKKTENTNRIDPKTRELAARVRAMSNIEMRTEMETPRFAEERPDKRVKGVLTIETDGVAAVLAHKKITPINTPSEIVKGRELGSGTFGVVMRCKFRETECALKQLHHHSVFLLEGLLSEFDTMMNLRHPNVLLTMGIAVDPADSSCGIVTELMQASLFDVIYEPSFRPYATWDVPNGAYLAIASDVAKGMSFIHYHGLLHRDLTPGNILIDARWVAKVADFGNVRDSNLGTAYDTEEIMGTPPYMAPEILKTRRYETATDVWAFGCVLAHMGTGKIPYQQLKLKDRNELFNVIRGGEVPPIQLLLDAPNTPSGILNVAKSCCMPEAAQRPSFQSIAEQLNAFFADDADPRPLMRVKDKKVFTAEARSASGLSLPLANSGHDSYRNKFRSKSALSPRPDGPLSPRSSDGASPGSHRAYTRRPSVAELDASALPISSAARSLMERRKSQEVSAEALESYRTMSPQNSNRQMSARSFLDSFSSTLLGTFTPGKEADAVSPDTAPPAPVSPEALPQSAALPRPSQLTADVEPTPKKSPVPAKAAAPSKAPPLNLEQMAPAPRAPAALESAAPTNAGDVMATFRDDATFRGDATFRAEDDEKKGDTTIKI